MKNFKVYLIRDKIKTIIYVGLTSQTLQRRYIQHCSKRQWNACDYCIELVEEYLTQEQAVLLEELLIEQYKTRSCGLNISPKSINGDAKPVMCLNDGISYPSARAAARFYDVSYCKISDVCNDKRHHTKGLRFKFIRNGRE